MPHAHPTIAMVVAVLAIWRLSHLIAHEDGPFDAITRVRGRVGDGFWGSLMDCAYCLSLWLAIPFAVWLALDWHLLPLPAIALWLALSGGSSVIEAFTPTPKEL